MRFFEAWQPYRPMQSDPGVPIDATPTHRCPMILSELSLDRLLASRAGLRLICRQQYALAICGTQ